MRVPARFVGTDADTLNVTGSVGGGECILEKRTQPEPSRDLGGDPGVAGGVVVSTVCPGCEATGLHTVLEVDRVPIHSNILLADPREAAAYPSGRLKLEACPECGLLHNSAFDEDLMDYSSSYEETQGFSGTFREFMIGLAEDLARRHDLRGGLAVEVGCGKGEFLVELCRAADCSGVGFDPAFVPRDDATEVDVEFHPRVLLPQDLALPADIVACRHTLEHVTEPVAMLSDMRRMVEARSGVVFVEVPDAGRILRDGAFWDVYYEHRSYFTRSSLEWAAHRAGLTTDVCRTAYGDQYLLFEGRAPDVPAAASRSPQRGLEDGDQSGFSERVRRSVEGWRARLDKADAEGHEVVLWGAGSKAVGFLTAIGDSGAIRRIVDVNPFKQGTFLPGTAQEIVSPLDLAADAPGLVVVMNGVYRREIADMLASSGVDTELITLDQGL